MSSDRYTNEISEVFASGFISKVLKFFHLKWVNNCLIVKSEISSSESNQKGQQNTHGGNRYD